MKYPDLMVDLETTGTQPEHTNIIQIAAVRFNLETGEVDDNFFDQCLRPLPTRYWDESTRQWWSKMPEVFDGIWRRMRDPMVVMNEFREFAADGPRLWAKPVSFEFPFLSSYFREAGLLNPFDFRRAIDLRSFIHGRYFPLPAPNIEKEIPFIGDEHNALFDTLHQVAVAIEAYQRTREDG